MSLCTREGREGNRESEKSWNPFLVAVQDSCGDCSVTNARSGCYTAESVCPELARLSGVRKRHPCGIVLRRYGRHMHRRCNASGTRT